jgi:hypothetical protein
MSGDFPFPKAGSGNRVLADVRDVLLEDEWREFSRTAATISATAGAAGQDGRQEKHEEDDEDDGCGRDRP